MPAAQAERESGPSDETPDASLSHEEYNNSYSLAAHSNGESHSRTSRAASPDGGSLFAGQYLGPASPYNFLRRAWQRFERDDFKADFVGAASEDLNPTESIFSYGDRNVPKPDRRVEGFRLPDRSSTALLTSQYFDLAMPTYRFLHAGTVRRWLEDYHRQESSPDQALLLPVQQAIVCMVLATARLFHADSNGVMRPDQQSWEDSERLFEVAQAKLRAERGKARLESVQARLVSCLHLLHTHRPNEAWYKFGTTVQLCMALGIHRAATLGPPAHHDPVNRECRRRTFWAASTLDTYLSAMLGRPPMIHLDDIDQRLPEAIDDEDLSSSDGATPERPVRDSVIKAAILHAQIERIVKKASREQYSAQRKTSREKLEAATSLNAETAAWRASLPVVLSGAIHPSSLIPTFRRQITVLQLAHAHALMLINRPSLLLDTGQVDLKEAQVDACISAAKSTLDTILAAGLGTHIFQVFWYTQFVGFNALSIVYVWLMQRKQGRLPETQGIEEDELLQLAESVQKDLIEASRTNAPSLRYSIVLEELHQEVQRMNSKPPQRLSHLSTILETHSGGPSQPSPNPMGVEEIVESVEAGAEDPLMEALARDFPLDPDLWLALDSFPFSDLGQIE
ncbi:fungal specific transcription factor domain-containing [Lecanosticta acicola]|uniref:Fungal specific transcription factor domain-containing n=1 Tax=Lecanosticta acicola TaxID=111012 RepID=A0AAI8Z945_9PEZI|nr:fungal specific transcription factor domain-containing [Lecanosticta acicola]